MLNLNNVPVNDQQPMERTLIPDNTICRAIITVKGGDTELPEFGQGTWFKRSATSSAKWMELEFTVVGGQFDRRKFWHRIFVDGDKIGQSGMPLAKEIGLRTLRQLIESGRNISPDDNSPQAQSSRNIGGIVDLNGMEVCAKIGVKKGNNGYEDTNQLKAALTPNQAEFIPMQGQYAGQSVPQQTQPQYTQAQPQQPSGAVPNWARQ